MLQRFGRKSRMDAWDKDFTLQYLGYSTDNGAYYYYNVEPLSDGSDGNYEDTLLRVKDYADEESIPYKYVLIDSWWYYEGIHDGVTVWCVLRKI